MGDCRKLVWGLVGGIYARENLPPFKDWICDLGRVDVLGWWIFSFSGRGFIKGERFFLELQKSRRMSHEDLETPFRCKQSIISKNERIFERGSLFAAFRASSSIPTFACSSGYRFESKYRCGSAQSIAIDF